MTAAASDARAALSALIRRLERATRRVCRGGDGEAEHDVRVATRRIGALLQVWRGALDDRLRRKVRRELKTLRRDLAETRDLQVLAAALRQRRDPAPIAEAIATWSRAVEEALTRLKASAARRCSPARLAKLRRDLRRVAASLPNDFAATAERTARDVLARRRKRAIKALAAAAQLPAMNAESGARRLHRARLRVKSWRYAEELVGSDSEARRAAMLQERLGTIHDAYALRAKATARGGLDPLVRRLDAEIQRGWDDFRADPVGARATAAAEEDDLSGTIFSGSRRTRAAPRRPRSTPSRSIRTRASSSRSSRSTRRRAAQSSSPAPRRASTRRIVRPPRRVTRTERTS
jgi:CHAD domain-containing protein